MRRGSLLVVVLWLAAVLLGVDVRFLDACLRFFWLILLLLPSFSL
jgi:hypothetical protein